MVPVNQDLVQDQKIPKDLQLFLDQTFLARITMIVQQENPALVAIVFLLCLQKTAEVVQTARAIRVAKLGLVEVLMVEVLIAEVLMVEVLIAEVLMVEVLIAEVEKGKIV